MELKPNDYLNLLNDLLSNGLFDEAIVELDYCIAKQFQSSLFLSDYKCYKVNYSSNDFVLKMSTKLESDILVSLKSFGISVPQVILTIPSLSSNKVIIFMELIEGIELSDTNVKEDWVRAAECLGKMHWSITENKFQLDESIKAKYYFDKFNNVLSSELLNKKYQSISNVVKDRVYNAPKLLSHGDCFPSNFIIDSKSVFLIDFEMMSSLPYFMDIARLTSTPLVNGSGLICPFPDDTINSYYEVVKNIFQLSKDEFLTDVYIGSIVEVMFLMIFEPNKSSKFYQYCIQLTDYFANKILSHLGEDEQANTHRYCL